VRTAEEREAIARSNDEVIKGFGCLLIFTTIIYQIVCYLMPLLGASTPQSSQAEMLALSESQCQIAFAE
jgi:hypothetical protein